MYLPGQNRYGTRGQEAGGESDLAVQHRRLLVVELFSRVQSCVVLSLRLLVLLLVLHLLTRIYTAVHVTQNYVSQPPEPKPERETKE